MTALVVRLAPRGWRCQVLRPGSAWDVHVEAYAPPQRRGRWAKPDGNERGIVSLRVRGDSARPRSTELAPSLDAWVWRPILGWTLDDVAAIHARHNLTPNPLYAMGAGRVGCWPCIGAGKQELRLLDERRVRCIEALEVAVGDENARRRAEAGKSALPTSPAFFQRATRNAEGRRPCTPIREIVAWAQTDHGGRQLLLPGLGGGCMGAGLCERTTR